VSKPKLLSVRRNQAGTSLLEFLAEQLKISKKNAKRMIDARVVFINTRRTWMAKHKLAAGDRVEVPADSEPGVERPKKAWPLHEAAGLLVVNKPPGIVSDGENSVESLLRSERQAPKLRAIHRLDKDTSGCLLFALNEEVRAQAISAFEDLEVAKKYLVIAVGKVPQDLGRVDQPIDGKSARTRFRILDSGPQATLLEATLETGRMHQIRRHLAAVQLGIAGDKQYGRQEIASSLLRGVSRQMLHAWKLEIPSLELKVTAPLPADFCETLNQFGLEAPKE
jgi:23S rRNA pseudouridine1911/1915/1917 synthase